MKEHDDGYAVHCANTKAALLLLLIFICGVFTGCLPVSVDVKRMVSNMPPAYSDDHPVSVCSEVYIPQNLAKDIGRTLLPPNTLPLNTTIALIRITTSAYFNPGYDDALNRVNTSPYNRSIVRKGFKSAQVEAQKLGADAIVVSDVHVFYKNHPVEIIDNTAGDITYYHYEVRPFPEGTAWVFKAVRFTKTKPNLGGMTP